MSQDTHYVYCIVRNDLTPSQKAVQAGHAVYESSRQFPSEEHPHFVFTVLKNENKLKAWIEKLQAARVSFTIWREPDMDNEITAIATEPIRTDSYKRGIFKKLQLLS